MRLRGLADWPAAGRIDFPRTCCAATSYFTRFHWSCLRLPNGRGRRVPSAQPSLRGSAFRFHLPRARRKPKAHPYSSCSHPFAADWRAAAVPPSVRGAPDRRLPAQHCFLFAWSRCAAEAGLGLLFLGLLCLGLRFLGLRFPALALPEPGHRAGRGRRCPWQMPEPRRYSMAGSEWSALCPSATADLRSGRLSKAAHFTPSIADSGRAKPTWIARRSESPIALPRDSIDR